MSDDDVVNEHSEWTFTRAAAPGSTKPPHVEAMVRCGNQLSDNEVVHILTLGPAP